MTGHMAEQGAGRGPERLGITPSDLGRRVSVRRVLDVRDGRPVYGDALGTLLAWADGVLVVETRDGSRVEMAEDSVVAGKVVPPPPVRRAGGRGAVAAHLAVPAEELQVVMGRGWPGVEEQRIGCWTLRAASGFTRRANSALPGRGFADLVGPDDLDERLGQVQGWYAERGLPAYVQVRDEEPLAGELERRGWREEGRAVLLTAPLSALRVPSAEVPVTLSRELSEGWLARYRRAEGEASDAASAVLRGGPSVWFASVGADCSAIGRCVVDGRWAGFAAVEVAPEARRSGLATAVMAALAERAAAEGAELAYLQVEEDNEPARKLYDRLGFDEHHRYHYRRSA